MKMTRVSSSESLLHTPQEHLIWRLRIFLLRFPYSAIFVRFFVMCSGLVYFGKSDDYLEALV